MTHARSPSRANRNATHRTLPTHLLLLAGLGVLLLALPATSALYVEGQAPSHAGSYVQADVAGPDDPLHNPLNLTDEQLRNLSARAADATASPGVLLNMTPSEEEAFHALQARLAEGQHDGVQVNGTGYRFAIAMADIFATGAPDGAGSEGPPAHEPTGDDTTDGETGEASGLAIGSLTLVSAGAMYWIRRLA